jgi:hypothetical protein
MENSPTTAAVRAIISPRFPVSIRMLIQNPHDPHDSNAGEDHDRQNIPLRRNRQLPPGNWQRVERPLEVVLPKRSRGQVETVEHLDAALVVGVETQVVLGRVSHYEALYKVMAIVAIALTLFLGGLALGMALHGSHALRTPSLVPAQTRPK